MSQHTPAPWEFGYDNEGNGSFHEWFTAGPAQIHFRSEGREQAEADAHLIAAAPQLLEACRESLRWAQGRSENWATLLADLLRLTITRAIATAQGKESRA